VGAGGAAAALVCVPYHQGAQVLKARQMEQKPLSKRKGLLMLMMV
jgi:hypothetical protein